MTKISKTTAVLLLCLAAMGVAHGDSTPPTAYAVTLTQGSRLMIEARINGHPVHALLDSAAEATLLNRRFAQDLQLANGEQVKGSGSGKEAFQASLVKGVTIQALGLTLADQTVAVTDLDDVGQRLLGARLDVILGREVFDAARLQIDIHARRIVVVSRAVQPRGVALELLTENGIETIPATVGDGVAVRATFDLGNGAHVLISKALAERLKLLSEGRVVGTEQGGGLGGATARQLVRLKSIQVAGRRFTQVDAAIDPQSSASDLNIGVSILQHFLITTDYSQHRVWLEPVGAASKHGQGT